MRDHVTGDRPSPRDVLTGVFGYEEFRPGQEKIIATVLAGRDCIGVMPTGAGKSLTFQIPARILPGTVLVLSPLISLMKDQVDALVRNGFRATVINSTLDLDTRRDRLQRLRAGEYELVYLAPEALEGSLRSFLAGVRLSLVVADEAHCISEWGHDFRPAYRRLRGLKEELGGLGGLPILALTATATRRVVADIIRQLGMVKPDGFKGSFFRPNLTLWVHKKGDGRGSRQDLLAYVRGRAGESGIIYTLSRKNVDSLAEFLRAAGVRAVPYHAGLDAAVRTRHQEAFARDQVDVVIATIAFGMGIDKSNVRYVIHRELPRSIESYYQEIGRAGRDGLASDCLLLYSWADVVSHARMQDGIEDAAVRASAGEKTRAMYAFADAPGCRQQRLVAYFDETMASRGVFKGIDKEAPPLPYRIEYSPEAEGHLRALTARQRSIVLYAVEEQLGHERKVETRNRKPMRPNPIAPWELRIDPLRVYYDVQEEPEQVVKVRAVGIKDRNQVRIGGEVIEL
jgi:ATP-dependent DNA helicase RecQ